MSDQRDQWVYLSSGELSAEVNPQGAQLSTLRDREGRDLLWDGDPRVWAGRAPLLFPIVGALAGGAYRLDSKIYHLSRHGFARDKRFNIIDSSPSAATFQLRADAASLEIYPFRFELDVHFSIEGPTLLLTTWIRNAGDEPMPASFGYHPGFRWPMPYDRDRAFHYIEFTYDEPAPMRRLNADGLLTPQPRPTPLSNRRLALRDDLFQDDVVIFDQVRSRSVIYGAADGPRIRISYPEMPYLGIWTKPGANFICIEPWHGIADPEGFSADFRAKPGAFIVAPGSFAPMRMAITLIDG
ncbi:MAG: aldose 1-epimerase family protein [Gammaproteobacteria bacterium]